MKRATSLMLVIVLLLGAAVEAGTFKDGDTVCFLGDSITHGRQFHSMIYAYYLTRFPNRTIRFVNAGIAGDSAGGALGRLEEDVLAKSPSVVVVMLGMNDVGRGNYVTNPTPKQLEAQARSLKHYAANMDKLLGRLKAETKARLVLLTPSPFDQTCLNDRDNNQPGCNDGLAKCASLVRQLAAKYRAEVVDLHGPMTALNLRRQKDDPRYTLIGPDRVHPGAPGNLMMAWLFLKAQGAPPLVSEVVFDAAAGRLVKAEGATLSNVEAKAGRWTFTVLEKALPLPVEAGARELLSTVPIQRDLNQQMLRVAGLPKGTYSLSIDGTPVASHTNDQWAAGVNLALNPATPQMKQAQDLAKLNEQRRRTEVRLRGYACVRWFLRHRRIDPDDLEAVRIFAETKMKKGYYQSHVPTYLKEWQQREEVVKQVAALEEELFRARRPVPHVYEIKHAGGPNQTATSTSNDAH